MTPVSVMVGANRIIPAAGIVHPLGNAELTPEQEKELRRKIVEKAVEALETELESQKVFDCPE
jgi:glycine reductase